MCCLRIQTQKPGRTCPCQPLKPHVRLSLLSLFSRTTQGIHRPGKRGSVTCLPLTYLEGKPKSCSFKSVKLVSIKLQTTLLVHSKRHPTDSHRSVIVFQRSSPGFDFYINFTTAQSETQVILVTGFKTVNQKVYTG